MGQLRGKKEKNGIRRECSGCRRGVLVLAGGGGVAAAPVGAAAGEAALGRTLASMTSRRLPQTRDVVRGVCDVQRMRGVSWLVL